MEMPSGQAAQQQWMRAWALAPRAKLEAARDALAASSDFTWPRFTRLRPTETGLVMVRARIGGSGGPFNFAEMTVTRASIRLEDGTVGQAWVAGRDADHAELAALFDALLQDPARRPSLLASVIAPLERERHARDASRAARVATTRVDFETLVRGDV
jgi:alpha-D-ribose 1-methylphosphonate 5-triphosphate synthase subunit PhnG